MSKEKTTGAVAKTEERQVATAENLEMLEKLRANSGEGQKMTWPFVPIIEVDNHKEEVVIKGKPKKVLCDPNLRITSRDDDGNYKTDIFGEEFYGSIILIKYIVEKKWKEGDSSPYFRSFEFDEAAFRDDRIPVTVTQQKEEIFKGSYSEFKEQFDDAYVLSAIVYVLEKNTDRLVRFKFKGVNRGAFWEYKDLFGTKDSISAYTTKFSINSVSENGKEYNHIVLTNEGLADDLSVVLTAQTQLVEYFKKLNKEDQAEEGIVVNKMPFGTSEVKES